jgi:hypothetical protein
MKSTTPESPATPQQALIFIPDISGFTQFVTETEVSHSKHIIEELLEILIDANKIGLEVSEIEGDAILFYRFGNAPTAQDLTEQVKEMFSKFHMHLKKYERHRICNCGACSTASKLAIKFIAHYGDVSINTIRQYKKLFGKDVIVAHRLLKNNIDSNQYSLFTDNLITASNTWNEINEKTWSPLQFAEQEYDSGKVSYCYCSLSPLLEQLPEPSHEDYSLKGMKSKVFESEEYIDAPIELVLNVMADIPWRSSWIPGTLETVTDMNTALAQTGQTHKCMANGPVIVSHDYSVSEHLVTFTETDIPKTYCVVYTLKKLDEHRTLLYSSMFLKKNFFKELVFRLFFKNKIIKVYNQATTNLKNYCESLAKEGKEHRYAIKIGSHPHMTEASPA